MDADKILTDAEMRTRVFFVSSAFVLLTVIIVPMSMGQGYRVLSAPSIVINGKLEYTGGLDETAFREHLKKLSGG